ncbi:hypothetical protein CEXT_110441 [Caerostris extrusa]|uniref:Uncharacterized protein n=1 Tax=Caerostris extrusa TaxID=172846 RepID=A0AAV4SU74_CAEEX|nr:hypothetical protein CEXT_110441 [Caerostris extrusa]
MLDITFATWTRQVTKLCTIMWLTSVKREVAKTVAAKGQNVNEVCSMSAKGNNMDETSVQTVYNIMSEHVALTCKSEVAKSVTAEGQTISLCPMSAVRHYVCNMDEAGVQTVHNTFPKHVVPVGKKVAKSVSAGRADY